MRRLVVVATVGMFLAGFAGTASAEGHKGPEVGIAASASWVKDLNSPSGLGAGTLNSASYPNPGANDESFNIDLVELSAMGKASENVSYEASIFFGDLTGAASGEGDTGGDVDSVAIHTASVTFPIGMIHTTVGRRATDIGYEVIQPWGNAHISRSFAFLAQPINHDGVKFGYDGGSWSAGLGIANDYSVADPANGVGMNDENQNKALTADVQFGVAGWGFKLAGVTSNDKAAPGAADNELTNINLVVQGDIGVLQTALEYNFFDFDVDPLAGTGAAAESDTIGLYLGQDTDCWGWDARLEYVDIDLSGPGAPASGELYGITLTGTWHITEGVDARLEYRHNEASDLAGETIFADDSTLGLDDAQDTVALQVVMY